MAVRPVINGDYLVRFPGPGDHWQNVAERIKEFVRENKPGSFIWEDSDKNPILTVKLTSVAHIKIELFEPFVPRNKGSDGRFLEVIKNACKTGADTPELEIIWLAVTAPASSCAESSESEDSIPELPGHRIGECAQCGFPSRDGNMDAETSQMWVAAGMIAMLSLLLIKR